MPRKTVGSTVQKTHQRIKHSELLKFRELGLYVVLRRLEKGTTKKPPSRELPSHLKQENCKLLTILLQLNSEKIGDP